LILFSSVEHEIIKHGFTNLVGTSEENELCKRLSINGKIILKYVINKRDMSGCGPNLSAS
jgi:hypothetical protein